MQLALKSLTALIFPAAKGTVKKSHN